MRRILFQQTDFNTLPNPPAGFNYIGFDGPNFSEKSEDGQISQNIGGTGATGPQGIQGPTGPAGSGGSASTDRLISSSSAYTHELILDNKGTLNIPLLLPATFNAICDDVHYDGDPDFSDTDWWEFEVEFAVNPNGEVETLINNIFPILTNPGYTSGDVFIFTEDDHGIPNFTFELQLNDVVFTGGVHWTANLTVTQPPIYPSTINSEGAIKLTSNSNNLIFGTLGDLTIPGTIRSNNSINLEAGDSVSILTNVTGETQSFIFNEDGDLVLPQGGDIKNHLGSSVLSGSLAEVTYSELLTMIDEGELTPGKFYKITDFKTCYDQPDYDYNSNPITDGNYKQGTVSPIIVFAISSDSLSSDAYQPEYPKDNIKYDVSFSQTEVTGGTAYGRIVYRKDNQGNAFDYDFREVFFKRYDAYFSEEVYDGTISIAASGSFGVVTGVDTFFDNFSTGSVVGVLNTNTEYIVDYYEIISIEDDTNMVVTGNVINTVNNTRLLDANLLTKVSWKQNNIISNTASSEFRTFGNINQCFSNTSTNTAAYTSWEEYTFLLPNNVFKGNVNYRDNSFGHDFRNNTFNTSCDSNRIGGSFYNNIIDNDFDNNIINDNFYSNIMDCDFQRNLINGEFYNNHLGDNDGNDFDYNIIQSSFYNNFYTGDDNFEYNLIKGNFDNNIILGEFSKNTLNGFYQNTTEATFSDNQVGESFYGNKTYQEFRENVIGDEVYDNNFFGTFIGNVLIGDEIYENNIYSDFGDNQIGGNFQNNNIGDSGNINNAYFGNNKIGNNFSNNTIIRNFEDNQIGNNFQQNNVYGDFYKNVIGNGFNGNGHIGHDFYGNHIGNGFNYNNYIGDYFKNNKIGEYFEDNYITNNFRENSIGNEFNNNTLGDRQYFTWNNTSIENLTTRDYSTFYNSLYGDNGENIGNVILGKELIMHFSRNSGSVIAGGELIIGETYEITNYQGTDDFTDVADIQSGVINTNGCVFIATGSTVSNWSSGSELTELTSYDEYHKVKFTQWTQNNNGGGFSYERTKVYPTSESTVYFTKLNYGSEVDVIIPGRLEIRRGNNGAIYNYVEEGGWNQNVSPQGTEWNSIYTQTQDGFTNNEIQNEFKGNLILREFSENKIGYGFSSNILYGYFVSNVTDGVFYSNDVNYFYSNRVGELFWENTIGDNFNNNEVDIWFSYNNIAPDFSNNKIGKYFQDNTIEEGFGSGYGDTQTNIIGDFFQNNNIGEYFYNNKVVSYFQDNNVGYYFQRNNIDTPISEEDFIVNYGNILAFTYQSSGTTSTPGFYNISGTTSGHGESASFGITVSGGTISTVSLVSAGTQYVVGNTISIPGTQIGGVSRAVGTFSINSLSVKIYTPADSTYQFPDNETEMDYLIDNSPLFDTYYSSNIQGVSYTTKTGLNQTQYAMVIEGYIKIPSDDTYYFGLSSDDGSDAFIDGIRVADWYGAHGDSGNVPGGTQSPISLTAGTYPIKVRLQQRNGQDIVILLYSLDGVSWNIIPDNWFTPDITGITGSYTNIVAQGTGSGENATFDVEVIGGLVDSVVLNNGGESYSIGEILTIPGSEFGGTQSIIINVDSLYSDDVTITVTAVSATPSVYETYNCQIFERRGGNKRLSFYDENDVLTIKNINE